MIGRDNWAADPRHPHAVGGLSDGHFHFIRFCKASVHDRGHGLVNVCDPDDGSRSRDFNCRVFRKYPLHLRCKSLRLIFPLLFSVAQDFEDIGSRSSSAGTYVLNSQASELFYTDACPGLSHNLRIGLFLCRDGHDSSGGGPPSLSWGGGASPLPPILLPGAGPAGRLGVMWGEATPLLRLPSSNRGPCWLPSSELLSYLLLLTPHRRVFLPVRRG